MDATNHSAYKRWVGAEWWSEGYEQLWEGGEVGAPSPAEGAEGESAEKSGRAAKRTKKQQPSRAARETVIYLTADADDELTELKEGETYIIGGIVDHNRYKVSVYTTRVIECNQCSPTSHLGMLDWQAYPRDFVLTTRCITEPLSRKV